MKKLLLPLAALILSGCVTSSTSTPLARIQSGAKVAAYVTASIDMQKHPARVVPYAKVRDGLALILTNETIDPLQVAEFLRTNLPVQNLNGDTTSIIVAAVGMLFADQLGAVEIKNPPEVKALATGIRDGLDIALAAYTPK